MQTKYILHINNTGYELHPEDIKNWDEVRCSYKRNNFDGVMRSFTSQFEFTNRAFELLREIFLSHGINARASIEVLTSNDRWEYETQFSCHLDFSTVEWESTILRINALDNSLESLIKANKGTKYEFPLDKDILDGREVRIPRIPMQESLLYGFTQGNSSEDIEDIFVHFQKNEHPWLGNKGNEMVINLAVDWNDDQTTEPDSYIFKAIKDIDIAFTHSYSYRSNQSFGSPVDIYLRVKRDNTVLPLSEAGCLCGSIRPYESNSDSMFNFGTFTSELELPDISVPQWSDNLHSQDRRVNGFAIVNGIVWYCRNMGWTWIWTSSGKNEDDYFLVEGSGDTVLHLKSGDVVFMENVFTGTASSSNIKFKKSEFWFKWMSRGEDVDVPVITPLRLCKSLLNKIVDSRLNVHVNISDYDPRIKNTYLMASESIRNISEGKVYSSFNEFTDWMSVVFGYVYYIGEEFPTQYKRKRYFGRISGTPYPTSGTFDGLPDERNIVYNKHKRCFFYADNGYYSQWKGCEEYNDINTGYARTDTVFFEIDSENVKGYVFPAYNGEETLDPQEYEVTPDAVGANEQNIYFVHRSELFEMREDNVHPKSGKDIKYSIDKSTIYSTVTIGYDKKDYGCVNGRDEFNFNITYTTGCTISDKTLSLLSKYRADCYGIEFAIQKRSKETTDSTSDKDIFFILCKEEDGELRVDRTTEVKNCISEDVFNGAFSPLACVEANKEFICIQSGAMTLTFTSSAGNSDAIIDGKALNGNIHLEHSIASCGVLDFTSDELDIQGKENDLTSVTGDGLMYRGFLKEVDIRYARTEAAKYKLIVKDIQPI